MKEFLAVVAILVCIILGLLIVGNVEKQEDCGAWRYTKHGPIFCEDWP
jgi:hypothetical protein